MSAAMPIFWKRFSIFRSDFGFLQTCIMFIYISRNKCTHVLLYFRVSVSVISIKGTSCKLMELGQVAEATQGQVCG